MNPEVARIAEALRRVGLISERTVLNDYLSVALARLDLPLLAAALYAAGLRLPEPPTTGLDVEPLAQKAEEYIEAVVSYLDPANQFTHSRRRHVDRTGEELAELVAAALTKAPK